MQTKSEKKNEKILNIQNLEIIMEKEIKFKKKKQSDWEWKKTKYDVNSKNMTTLIGKNAWNNYIN